MSVREVKLLANIIIHNLSETNYFDYLLKIVIKFT